MDLTAIFTDDQLGVLGCFVALSTCLLIAAVSFHTGPAGKRSHQRPEVSPAVKATKRAVTTADSETRRAA